MLKVLQSFLCLCLAVTEINAVTEAQIRARFIQMGIECNQEIPLSVDEMRTLHEHKLPPGEAPKCLLACVYRKANWMNNQGTFDLDPAHTNTEEDYKDEPEKQKNAKQLFELCSKVQHKYNGTLNTVYFYIFSTGFSISLAESLCHGVETREFVPCHESVNEESVSDGTKGCDRSALLFQCLTENAPKHGFNI